ncbi:MAG: DUF1467 family protein [Alphaproteobacteria bacterium]|nr:DUF1467 family protein [Alphaproteobacteria bacterium]
MNIIGAVVIYILAWWTVFFAVLPWGVKSRWEAPDDGVKGAEPGAPVAANMKKKLLITSAIAFVIMAMMVGLIDTGVLNFRQ